MTQRRKQRYQRTSIEDHRQLSLFGITAEPEAPVAAAPSPPEPQAQVSTLFDFVKARLDYGPDMTPEEYQRWIKVLIHHSLKSIR
jgi:hypothetical protein